MEGLTFCMEAFTFLLAALALAASVYGMVNQSKLQRRLEALEGARAQAAVLGPAGRRASLTAALLVLPDSRRTVLRIANHGPGAARDVTVTLDGKPLAEHRSVWHHEPIEQIHPGEHVDVAMVLTKVTPAPPFEAALTWVDDGGRKDPPAKMTVDWHIA